MNTREPQAPESTQSEQWLIDPKILIEQAPIGILVVDQQGRIRMANSQAEQQFGYSREELDGAEVELLIPARYHHSHLRYREAYVQHPTARPMGQGYALSARRRDGSEFSVEISLSPIETERGTYTMAAIRDITDRLRLEAERNLLSVELETERERHRIAMDLHDGITQEVYATALALELALEDVDERRDDAKLAVSHAIDELHKVIRNIRSYIFDLRPREFTGSLQQALSELVREFSQNSQLPAPVEIDEDLPEIQQDRAMMLYHIAHEALSNVRKHAGAGSVHVSLRRVPGGVRLEVVDDGRGFDTSAEVPEHHRGMRNMAKRAQDAGAAFEVKSQPGKGTRVRVTLPLQSSGTATGR